MDQKYWILILLWVLYFGIHSLTATTIFKRYFERIGISKLTFRKAYVIFSTFALLALLIYSSAFREDYLIKPGNLTKYTGLALAASGTIIIRSAFKQYSLRGFLGLSNENASGQLVTRGILSYVRHPLYSGTILIIQGYFLYIPKLSSLIVNLIVLIYLIIGIYLEERKLEMEFGQKYLDYKTRVPALIPRLKGIF